MFVVCFSLLVVRCLLLVLRCLMLFVVACFVSLGSSSLSFLFVLSVTCFTFVVCYVLFNASCLFGISCSLFVVRCVPCVVRCLFFVGQCLLSLFVERCV